MSILDYFKYFYKYRNCIYKKLELELKRKPTSNELFDRYNFIFKHLMNIKKLKSKSINILHLH